MNDRERERGLPSTAHTKLRTPTLCYDPPTMRCESCNAPLQAGAVSCSFCQTLTPEGYQLRLAEAERAREREAAEAEAKRQRQAQESAAAREEMERKLKSSATGALVTGLIGVVPVCGLIFSIAAIVLGITTRRAARRSGLPIPGTATAGMVLGISTLFLCTGFTGLGAYIDHQDKEHRKELRASIERNLADERLAQNVACALTELQLLETGYASYSASGSFTCGTALMQTGARAVLGESEIEVGSKKTKVVSCLEREATFGKWKVAQLRADTDCDAPPAVEPKKKNVASDGPK